MKWLTNKNRPFTIQVSAILLSIIAQIILKQQPILSISLFVVGIGFFIYTLIPSKDSIGMDLPLKVIIPDKFSRWFIPVVAGSLLVGAISFWLFSTQVPTSISWLIHLVSLLTATFGVFFLTPTRKRNTQKTNPWDRGEKIALAFILLVGLFLRIYKLAEQPYGFWYDEADHALSAVDMIANPFNFPVFTQSPVLPSHLIFLLSLSIRLFGQTIFAVRIVSAILGVATIAAAFFTANQLFSRRTSLFVAFIFAFLRWDLIWSRMGMHGVTVPLFELITIGFLLRGIRTSRIADFFISGLALGLGLCFYISFRVFPLVVVIFLVFYAIKFPLFIKKYYVHLLVFLLGAVLISVPITQFATFHFSEFWQRTSYVSIFHDRTPLQGLETAIRTTSEHLLMFNFRGDHNGRHNIPGEPMLDIVLGGLFVLGISISLFKIRKPSSFLLAVWFLVTLLPGIFSLDFESPQSYRSIGAIPPVIFLAILPIHQLQETWKDTGKRKYRNWILVPLIALLVISGFINGYQYFVIQARNPDSWAQHSTTDTIIARRMNSFGPDTQYFVSTFNYQTPTIRFLAPEETDYQRIETYQTFPFDLDDQSDALFFLDPERQAVFNQAKQLYPNAKFEEIKSTNGSVILLMVHLTPSDIQSIQGLSIEFISTTGTIGQPIILPNPVADYAALQKPDKSFSIRLTGYIYAKEYGIYRLCPSELPLASFQLDHSAQPACTDIKQNEGIELAKGIHPIDVTIPGSPREINLRWAAPGTTDLQPIPASALFTPYISNHGLLGKFYPNGDWTGEPKFTEISPFIDFYYHNTPLERPYTVEWTGFISIPTDGEYELGLESIDESELYLDGKLLIEATTPNQYQPTTIALKAGKYPITVRFADRTGSTHIHLWWVPPGGEHSIIPQEVFSLPNSEQKPD